MSTYFKLEVPALADAMGGIPTRGSERSEHSPESMPGDVGSSPAVDAPAWCKQIPAALATAVSYCCWSSVRVMDADLVPPLMCHPRSTAALEAVSQVRALGRNHFQ